MNNDRLLTSDNHQLEPREPNLIDKEEVFSSLASSVAHDLEVPLRSLTKFTELLAEEYQGEMDAKAQQYLAQIADNGSKIQALIRDLVTYAHAASGEQTWMTVDLNQIVAQVQLDLQSAIAKTRAKITVHDLPQLLISPHDIYQLWQNLLDNALKYQGATMPQIEISAIAQEQQWLFVIRDNGVGIAVEDQSLIFDIFQRLNSSHLNPGMGIGLAICQKIVHRYGGKIWVESQVGVGSTFFFSLPMEICPQSPDAKII